MTTVGHDHAVAVSQQLQAVDDVDTNIIYGTFRGDRQQKVHLQHAAGIDVVLLNEPVAQRSEACLTSVAQRAIRIYDLIHSNVDLLVWIVVKVRGVEPSGLCSFIKHREVAFRGFLR